jgi:hypothetical protein
LYAQRVLPVAGEYGSRPPDVTKERFRAGIS